eukprot:TRINITY_DN2261_c1_g1_i2.p1 TRINITY_DN2261_c1_g1~~TRINITY_DN2261_c1_g1_i2.p1  ORF type:complete len:641 (-),score=162.60 TRINITY_DN2261_c1_g1_i2:378-2300(-)
MKSAFVFVLLVAIFQLAFGWRSWHWGSRWSWRPFHLGTSHKKIHQYANSLNSETENGWGRKLDGKLGHGFDITTGEVGLPLMKVPIDYNNKYSGFSLPPAQLVTSDKRYRKTFAAYPNYSFNSMRNMRMTMLNYGTRSYVSNNGMFGANLATTKSQYYLGEKILGVGDFQFEIARLCVKDPAHGTVSRWAKLAMEELPTTYSSYADKTAYAAFVQHWGTHYIKCSAVGGSIQQLHKTDYSYTHSQMGTQITRKFHYDTGINVSTGNYDPSHKPSVDATYKKVTQTNNNCYGGNIAQCNRNYSAWLNSVASNPTVLKVQIAPISEIMKRYDATKGRNIDTAMQAYVKTKTGSWSSINTCPRCSMGSCSNGRDYCSCRGHAIGRTCSSCQTGYKGTNCNTPHCSRCNTTGGSCVSPNKCQCKNCYGGAACDSYTCGCIAGDGMVNLANNSTILASEVKVGDRVQVMLADGTQSFEDVYYVRSRPMDEKIGIFKIITESKKEIVLTKDHLLYVSENGSSFEDRRAVKAEDIMVGMKIWISDEEMATTSSVISTETFMTQAPLMSIQTLEGNIVVDGTIVSNYETEENWGYLDSLEERVVYKMFPALAKSEAYKKYSDFFEDITTTATTWIAETFEKVFSSKSE